MRESLNVSTSWIYHTYRVIAFSYYSLGKNSQEYEKARKVKSQNNLKATAEIIAVIFEDGSILK